jgi:VanZ family protein
MRWSLWTLFAIVWTVCLEAPGPLQQPDPSAITEMTLRLLIAKSLHVSAYAFFTVLSAWPRLPMRYRWLMMFFLMAHATVTEVVQAVMHEWWGRTGDLWDVAFDQIGILIGFLIAWKWWMRPD